MKKEKHAAISHKHEILKQTSIKLLTNGLYHQIVPGNGSELKIKVLYFDKELELSSTFHGSDEWLDRWRKRFDHWFKAISGIL